ncbi:hypothetical protein BLS_006885 [Venturia inaequalis]|uniref:MFS general substrate transporter n=1 Tax=Venturia inaequalis TaxID=5025 RepID=A0A8H3UBS0_VENIN|nr:hypothetical protein BLS_006885 [Venturia inaequalis]
MAERRRRLRYNIADRVSSDARRPAPWAKERKALLNIMAHTTELVDGPSCWAGGIDTDMRDSVKLSTLGEATLDPEESIALRRRSTDSLSDVGDDGDSALSALSALGQSDTMVDGGREAWRALFAAWLIDFMTSGAWVTFGLFQVHYLTNPLFEKEPKGIATIGTFLSGISWLATPLTNALVLRYTSQRKQMLWTGWLMCPLGLVAASFATHVWQLQLFQGIVYGAAWVIYWSPLLVMVNEYWIHRRGLAYGIWFTASNASGLVMPFIVQKLLDRYHFRITLRLLALASILIAGPAVALLQPRRSQMASMHSAPKLTSLSSLIIPARHIFTNIHFAAFSAASILQSLAIIVPLLFLPSFAASMSLPAAAASQLLALSSIATIGGQMVFGRFSDTLHPYVLSSSTTFICGIAAFAARGATGFMGLAVLATIWGIFAAPYDVLFTRMCAVLTPDSDEALVLYGYLSLERGLAVLAQGWIGANMVGGEEEGFGRYRRLLGFCGMCMLGSSLCGVGWFWPGRGK